MIVNNKKISVIDHSRLLSLPIVNTLLYIIQLFFVSLGISIPIYISRKNNTYKDHLLKLISKQFNHLICKSYKLGDEIKKINIPTILNMNQINIKHLSTNDKHQLMWSLVHAKAVAYKTGSLIQDLIPSNYQLKRLIVIPINDPLNVLCDYITQTAKTLAKRGEIVFLVARGNSVNIFKYIITKLIFNPNMLWYRFRNKFGITKISPETNNNEPFKNILNLQIVYPIYLFPKSLYKFHIIEKVDRKISNYLIIKFITNVNPDIFWTFDSLDLRLVRSIKGKIKTLYDCVDYFSTLDPILDRIIQERERRLIKSVDFFFVNSHVLANTRGKIRKPDAIVPQGFDIESFSNNSHTRKEEVEELNNIKDVFKNIPKLIVGLVGNISYRIDFNLLIKVIKSLPRVSFVLTDAFLPMPNDDRFTSTQVKIEELKTLPNLYLIPKTKYRIVIKEIIKHFDIGMVPYDTKFDFNKYCYPMKLFEYFYMGLPVISTPIEELRRFPNFVKIGSTDLEWGGIINDLLSKHWSRKLKYEERKLALKNSWGNKVKAIISMI